MSRIRISKYLADCGLGSRRKCENLVREGKVKINGSVIRELSYKLELGDEVSLEQEVIKPQPKRVIALNKPPGYLCTLNDNFGRKIITDLIAEDIRLYPVGRLDYDSRGLIIMTNDGELSYHLTHPKFMIPKTYRVKIEGAIRKRDINQLSKGIEIENRQVDILNIALRSSKSSHSFIELEIVEGRKRIIRRVFKKLGYRVLDLCRTKIGNYSLDDLKQGEYTILSQKQILKLTASKDS